VNNFGNVIEIARTVIINENLSSIKFKITIKFI